ncbi:MAG: sigma-70 family RNA polymerase sigma factor [Acidobacteriaceae bacterium]
MENDSGQVTQLLKAMQAGDSQAAQDLLPLVYSELHRLAKAYMRRERPDHTLQATALINEAYLRLAGEEIDWKNRAHFIGLSAQVMRRVLVDYARAHNAEHRGGALQRVEMEEELAIAPEKLEQVQQIDDLLKKLETVNPRQARVVELRYFGGLTFEEISVLLQLTSRTVKSDWALARIWLFDQLQPGAKPPREEPE